MNVLTLLVLVVGLLLHPIQSDASDELVFSTLSRGSSEKDLISEERLRRAYSQLGKTIRVEAYPGLRALLLANKGETDGELRRSMIDHQQYPNLIRIPAPVNYLNLCAFSVQKQTEFNGRNDLGKYNVGVVRGGRQSEKLGKEASSMRLVSTIEQLLLMLEAYRIQLGIGNCEILNRLQASSKTSFHIYSPALKRIPLYHYLNKKHSNLVGPLTRALSDLEKDAPYSDSSDTL